MPPMNPAFSPTPVHPAIERIRNQSQALNTPMECVDCGSSYFVDLHAHEYANAGYGSVQFRQLTVAPVPVKMCIGCSRIVNPTSNGGKSHPASTPRFQDSVKLGEDYRERTRLNANAVASKREFDALWDQVQSLIQQGTAVPGTFTIAIKETSSADPAIPAHSGQVLIVNDEPVVPPAEIIEDADKGPSLGDLMNQRSGRTHSKPPAPKKRTNG